MYRKGFTIVELLIVVSVIIILAAIVIVTYNAAENNGFDAAIKSDLDSAQGLFESFRTNTSSTSTYPQTTTDLTGLALKASKNSYNQTVASNYVYCVNSSNFQSYYIAALSKSGNIFVMSQDGLVSNTLTSSSFANATTLCTSLGSSFSLVASGMSSAGTWQSWMSS